MVFVVTKPQQGSMIWWKFKEENTYGRGYVEYIDYGLIRLSPYLGATFGTVVDPEHIDWKLP